MRTLSALFVCGTIVLGLAACGGSDTPASPSPSPSPSPEPTPAPPTPPPSSNTGRLLVRLAAGSFEPAKAVLVTFSRVRVYRGSPTNFSDVPLSGGGAQYTCDVKKLVQAEGEIAVGTIPAAAYSQVSLVVQSVTVHLDNPTAGTPCAPSIAQPGGRSSTLSVPGGEVPLPRNFDVRTGTDAIVRLSFNTEQSIRVTGENAFSFTPIFSVIGVQ
jgi:hypothetical protein